MPEKNGINRFFRLTTSKQEYASKLLASFDKYALFSFTTPFFTDDFWFEYTSSRKEKCQTSYKLNGKDFNEPVNFMLDLVFVDKPNSDIAKIGIVEELYTLTLLIPTDKDFIALTGFLSGKREYKSRFASSVKYYYEHRDMETMQREFAHRKGMFYLYYLMATIYH